jgi:hypothetical protein
MATRVIGSVVLGALVLTTLTGCGRQVSNESSQSWDLLARGPEGGRAPVPRPWAVPAIEAAGGQAHWMKCTALGFTGVVTLYQPDGSFYLTEHRFDICPWSDAIQVSAREPQAQVVWQVVGTQYYPPPEDPNRGTSPLHGFYRDYAGAVLDIMTAPVCLLEQGSSLTPRPVTVQMGGQWYRLLEAKFRSASAVSRGKRLEKSPGAEPYWTHAVYYQNQDGSLVDMIWLANPATQKFVVVRGYDYAATTDEVRVPTKIEVFRSDADANLGARVALIDLKR